MRMFTMIQREEQKHRRPKDLWSPTKNAVRLDYDLLLVDEGPLIDLMRTSNPVLNCC
jgi:hypothetical protein